MKKMIALFTLLLLLSGCFSVKQIGDLNMISTRNIDSKTEYVVVRNYMGGSKKELKKLKAPNLEQALDNVVRNTPGGEYVMNAKVFIINGKYFAIEGDVWGKPGDHNFKGFKVGDIVQWKERTKIHRGTIVDLKDHIVATVKDDDSDVLTKVKYADMIKVNQGSKNGTE